MLGRGSGAFIGDAIGEGKLVDALTAAALIPQHCLLTLQLKQPFLSGSLLAAPEIQTLGQRFLIALLELENGGAALGQLAIQPVDFLLKKFQRLPCRAGAHGHIRAQDQCHQLVRNGCGHLCGRCLEAHRDKRRAPFTTS